MRSHQSQEFSQSLISFLICSSLVFILCVPWTPRASARPESPKGNGSPLTLAPNQGSSRHRSGELLVRFRAGTSEPDKETTIAAHGARRQRQLSGESGVEKLELPTGQDPESVSRLLKLNPAVELVEPNFLINQDELHPELTGASNIRGPHFPSSGLMGITEPDPNPSRVGEFDPFARLTNPNPGMAATTPQVFPGAQPNDPRFAEQWALRNTGQNSGQFGSDINVATAWQTTTGSPSTVIAVIDSGIDFTHPDLSNNKWTNPNPNPGGDLNGWDYTTNSGVIRDEQGHGTAIAGIIAAFDGTKWRIENDVNLAR